VFGSLVKVHAVGGHKVYGLIHDVRMEDDPYVRQLASAEELQSLEVIEDQRKNRQVPIEVGVLVVGFQNGESLYHWLPPQPPLSLNVIHVCTPAELVAFTHEFGYFRLVLDSYDVPADELLAANLRYAAAARDGGGRDFLVDAGWELARLLALDLGRLDGILRRIRP
jgi:hypothetical protein